MIITHYDVLRITAKATIEEIKHSYKILAKKYHPDINKEDTAKEDFLLIYEAFTTLIDKERKREYDKFINKIAV